MLQRAFGTVVHGEAELLGSDSVQCGRGLDAHRLPATTTRQPQQHAHVAADIEKPALLGDVGLDQLKLFHVIGNLDGARLAQR